MPIDFHDNCNKQSYTRRIADKSWIDTIKKLFDYKCPNQALDIGCGGGIYTKALADIGIPEVTGVDFSEAMISDAKQNGHYYDQLQFKIGNAYNTSLPSHTYDFILERALIHHLTDLKKAFSEASRLLTHDGTLLIQDRTPSDCLLRGSQHHIRGCIFALFPRLTVVEVKRRHTSENVRQALNAAGFSEVEETKLWEVRKSYPSKEELFSDIRSRHGRSILHELADADLEKLIAYLDDKLPNDGKITEKDRWTIWKAKKA